MRLRGPWDCEPIERTDQGPLPAPCRVTLPCRWADDAIGPFAGRVRLRRHFGYPGRIDPHERVWLTFAAADRDATVWLNGALLGRHRGAFEPFEFEVTTHLRPRNELILELDSPATGGPWGEVALEVRCPAFLQSLRLSAVFEAGTALRLDGELAGQGDGLELYILVDGRTISYTADLAASSEVVALSATAQVPHAELWWPRGYGPAALHPVRVDLVQGGALWYAWECVFGFRDLVELGPDRIRVNGRDLSLEPMRDGTGNYLGTVIAELPIATDATHAHCDREGVLLRQALPRSVGDAEEDRRQADALIERLQRRACVIGFDLA